MLNRLSASGLKATSAEAYSKDGSTVRSVADPENFGGRGF